MVVLAVLNRPSVDSGLAALEAIRITLRFREGWFGDGRGASGMENDRLLALPCLQPARSVRRGIAWGRRAAEMSFGLGVSVVGHIFPERSRTCGFCVTEGLCFGVFHVEHSVLACVRFAAGRGRALRALGR